MSFYSQVIFPRLCDLLLGRPAIARYRKRLLAQTSGEILEIGIGTGLNVPHYPPQVRKITAVDPSPGMRRLALRRVEKTGIAVDLRLLNGEALPFGDGSFDFVVSTFTLCSIDHVEQALTEAHRVLRPGGGLVFLEHGLSPVPAVRKWQRRLNRLEMLLAGGCRLDRNIRGLIAGPPFRATEVQEFDLENTPRTHGHLFQGLATK